MREREQQAASGQMHADVSGQAEDVWPAGLPADWREVEEQDGEHAQQRAAHRPRHAAMLDRLLREMSGDRNAQTVNCAHVRCPPSVGVVAVVGQRGGCQEAADAAEDPLAMPQLQEGGGKNECSGREAQRVLEAIGEMTGANHRKCASISTQRYKEVLIAGDHAHRSEENYSERRGGSSRQTARRTTHEP